jgi:hypothetical protein
MAPESSLEWLRLSAHYRAMTDGELISIARQSSKLTEIAQQVLASEVSQRRLLIPPEEEEPPPPPPRPEPSPDSPYAEDRELVQICSVWSVSDALKLQWLLDRAGIPFFMGPEKATGVDEVTSDFSKVSVFRSCASAFFGRTKPCVTIFRKTNPLANK